MVAQKPETVPHLYAELLPNIRQITLYVSRSGPTGVSGNGLTTAESSSSFSPSLILSDSRSSVSVSYSGQTTELSLPARVAPSAHHTLSHALSPNSKGPLHEGREFSVRLPIDDTGTAGGLAERHEVQVPWSAKNLSASTRVQCRECGNEIFSPGINSRVEWKDLPAADWAEMMDLWHCHKPDPHEDEHSTGTQNTFNGAHENIESVKGYGAANRVVCAPGTIFVDTTAFVLAESDCRSLKKKYPTSSSVSGGSDAINPASGLNIPTLLCDACDANIGEGQPSLEGLKLYKANISIPKQDSGPVTTNGSPSNTRQIIPVDMIVAAQLLVLIDRTGARRFAVHSGDESSSDGILVWVFNPSLHYSSLNPSSTTTAVSSQHAMKVFYQTLPQAELQNLLHPPNGKVASTALEEVSLPTGIYASLQQSLEASNLILPYSAREFREWRVGLLDLYEEGKGS